MTGPRLSGVPLRILVAAGVVAVLLVGGGLVFASLPTPTPAPSASGSAGPRGSSLVDPTPAPRSDAAPSSPNPIGPRTSTEVRTQTPTPGPVALPAPTDLPNPFVGAPPASRTRSGGLAAGFPPAIPVPAGTTITRSSISTTGSRVQAEYSATSTASPSAQLALFTTGFAAYGVNGQDAPAVAGARAIVYSRGNDSVTVTVSAKGQGSVVSVFAALDYGS